MTHSQSRDMEIVSVEGNWDDRINERRLDRAAFYFKEHSSDFIIVSGTYQPGVVNRNRGVKLGERNAALLQDKHGIPALRVFPAHQFPFEFTYTTIEAFANATTIGWIQSGLQADASRTMLSFTPVTSGTHVTRVALLNHRACKALRQFNIEVRVNILKDELDNDEISSVDEHCKIQKLLAPGAALDTGNWYHGDHLRSLDDADSMREHMRLLIRKLLPTASPADIDSLLSEPSFAVRVFIASLLGHISAGNQLTHPAFEGATVFARGLASGFKSNDTTSAMEIMSAGTG